MDIRTERLLAWYDRNARILPWRGIHDPYRTWVSEIMLQQTRVETVMGYYHRFLTAFPTLETLARAEEAEVLKLWEGLGYYSRARNFLEGARQVMRDYEGVLPRNPEDLRKITGIGPYTAGAIASIAYGVPVAAVDGNVIRVISRLYAVEENLGETEARKRVEKLATELVPDERPGDHNQAMMDLGAGICIPGTPECEKCPLIGLCIGEKKGIAAELPKLPRAKVPREICYDLFLLYSGNRILMRKRTEKLLQGLWCFPMMEGWECAEKRENEIAGKWGWQSEKTAYKGEATHFFTHQVWRMRLYEMDIIPDAQAPKGYAFISAGSLRDLAIPTAVKAAKNLAAERAGNGLIHEKKRNCKKT